MQRKIKVFVFGTFFFLNMIIILVYKNGDLKITGIDNISIGSKIYHATRQKLGADLERSIFHDRENDVTDKDQVLPVLVLAYLRSGSTFTASILQQAPNSFYVFEPLLKFLERTSLKTKPSCTDTDYFSEDCRETMVNKAMLDQISQFYLCNYTTSFFKPDIQAGRSDSQRFLYNCLRTRNNTTESCYLQTKEMCLKSKVRVIKVIRMSMRLTKRIFEDVPNLKIIHLIRDPRGVIGSRQYGDFMTKDNKYLLSAVDICRRYQKDIEAADEIETLWPNSIKRLYYENLATNTYGTAKEMFGFLGIPLPSHLQKWVKDHTTSKSSNGYYGTHRSNSSKIVQKWRQTLSNQTIKNIDQKCEHFYKSTGYMYRSLELMDRQPPLR